MKILILGGFLGSGKTTALMQLAHYMVSASSSESENKVVILENEVGEVGIDDAYLRGGGFSVSNLFSGCACCTVSGELVTAAARVKHEMNPDWLIVETTGVAYPINMRDNILSSLNIESRICILVDAFRWKRLLIPMNTLLSGQIEGSDIVLINKSDLVDEEALQKIEADILGFEPNAVFRRISALGTIDPEVWEAVTQQADTER